MGLHYILALAGFVLSIRGFVEFGCLRGNAGSNKYCSNPLSLRAARAYPVGVDSGDSQRSVDERIWRP
jgi:hypothetical protein